MFSLTLGLLLLVGSILIYFLPTFLARHKKTFKNVFIINLVLGWTILGWCFALLLSLGSEPDQATGNRSITDDLDTNNDKLEYSSAANRRRKLRF